MPRGEIKRADVDGTPVCVVRVDDGEFFAIDDQCTHGWSSLSGEGWLQGREIECGLHSTVFDVTTGEPLSPPATVALRTYTVLIDGDDLLISDDG
jgi:3-phenylpropionate/trans-cinnamate dioxygenase ferredoxin subunit